MNPNDTAHHPNRSLRIPSYCVEPLEVHPDILRQQFSAFMATNQFISLQLKETTTLHDVLIKTARCYADLKIKHEELEQLHATVMAHIKGEPNPHCFNPMNLPEDAQHAFMLRKEHDERGRLSTELATNLKNVQEAFATMRKDYLALHSRHLTHLANDRRRRQRASKKGKRS